jgi:hypothetical protein
VKRKRFGQNSNQRGEGVKENNSFTDCHHNFFAVGKHTGPDADSPDDSRGSRRQKPEPT